MKPTDTTEVQRAIEAVWRIEAPRLIGGLVRHCKSLDLAEDCAQDAFEKALVAWTTSGIPQNPGAWLMTTAKNRAVDHFRKSQMRGRKQVEMVVDAEVEGGALAPRAHAAPDEALASSGDDLLGLVLIACHPVLREDARVALTLRLVGGLSTEEIARAFLLPTATIAQRIVRAKRTLSEAKVPFDVPEGDALFERLPSVLEVIYLIFNEGYAASAGEHWMRPALCQEAMRLGRVLAALVPQETEAHGLVALMELQASRMRARLDASGKPVLLLDQARSRWDHTLIRHGLQALERAQRLRRPLGTYTLQASIAGCHARARSAEHTDWAQIVALYDALAQLTGSAVVELNRAVAVSMAFGAEEALEILDALAESERLSSYHYLPAVRGDVLEKLGRLEEARAAFITAAKMARNEQERGVLRARANALRGGQVLDQDLAADRDQDQTSEDIKPGTERPSEKTTRP